MPYPPFEILNAIAKILKKRDEKLYLHFKKCGINSDLYIWSNLQCFYSNFYNQNEWAILVDHFLTNNVQFLYHFAIAHLLCNSTRLQLLKNSTEFGTFFRGKTRGKCNVLQVVERALQISKSTNIEFVSGKLKPLVFGDYQPIQFNVKCVVNTRTNVLENIIKQEEELITKRLEKLDDLESDDVEQVPRDIDTGLLLKQGKMNN